MKTAQVDLVWSHDASRRPDGTPVCLAGGNMDLWFRQSMRLAIPDTATPQDVKELGWNYLYEAAYWLQIDWEPIGDSEDGKDYSQEYSVVLIADDPAKAHATLIHDALTNDLVIEDEWIRERAESFVEGCRELREAKEADEKDEGWLDPWQEETRSKGQRPHQLTWDQRAKWKLP